MSAINIAAKIREESAGQSCHTSDIISIDLSKTLHALSRVWHTTR
jgi:hypothetical protein